MIRVNSCFVLTHLFTVNNVQIVYIFKEEVKEFIVKMNLDIL